MDCTWLLDEADEQESLGSETSDIEEIDHEVESRLYAIVHHNDLSQPLSQDLAKHYSLERSDDGDITVTLNHSLDDLKSEESKEIDKIFKASNHIDNEVLGNDNQEIIVISDDENNKKSVEVEIIKHVQTKKRFRYSDINIDEVNSIDKEINIDYSKNMTRITDVETSDMNHVKHIISYDDINSSNIKIPSFFDFSDRNCNSDTSFIPIKSRVIAQQKFRWKLKKALIHLNPGVKKTKVYRFADELWKKNIKFAKKMERLKSRNAMSKTLMNGLDIINNLPIEVENNFVAGEEITADCPESPQKSQKLDQSGEMCINVSSLNKRENPKFKTKKKTRGSISLNITPFRPKSLIEEPSKEKMNIVEENTSSVNTSQSYIPTKWNKQMIAFYTVPSKRKMKYNIDSIFNMFAETTKAEDWKLDPQDETGVYQRVQMGFKGEIQRRCPNCNRKGHKAKNCPEQKRRLVCFLCGDNFHSGYACHKSVCIKCGVYTAEGECVDCYYHTFKFDTQCERCGSALHRTPNCPDSWRSFHATIGGELKVPEASSVNQRKFCCNCARWGHFSHSCPTTNHTGQQTSPFVTNYSMSPLQNGSTEVYLPYKYEEIINSPEADMFLQELSNSSKTHIGMDLSTKGIIITINGTFEQCTNVKSEIEEYVNTKKRKREEPPIRRKRRRLK